MATHVHSTAHKSYRTRRSGTAARSRQYRWRQDARRCYNFFAVSAIAGARGAPTQQHRGDLSWWDQHRGGSQKAPQRRRGFGSSALGVRAARSHCHRRIAQWLNSQLHTHLTQDCIQVAEPNHTLVEFHQTLGIQVPDKSRNRFWPCPHK